MSAPRAPASTVRLQSVMRPSMGSAATADPVYSTTSPRAPRAEMVLRTVSARSFAPEPAGSSPVIVTRMVPAVR